MMPADTRSAFERLVALAKRETGQARQVTNFIFAWWNAGSLGGFDIADLFGIDEAHALDMALVFSWVATQQSAVYPTEYRADIEGLIEEWRPEVWARSRGANH
jgi:hypothetical protein